MGHRVPLKWDKVGHEWDKKMSHLSRKCPKNGTTGQKSETKWDKKCPGLIENVQGGQVGHRLNVKKCPSGTKCPA